MENKPLKYGKPYVLYGDEWEKRMMKVDKRTIIGMFRNLALSYQQCQDDLSKVLCEFRRAVENEPKTPDSNL